MQLERIVLLKPFGVDAPLPDFLVQPGIGDPDHGVRVGVRFLTGVEPVVGRIELVAVDLVQTEHGDVRGVVPTLNSRGDDAARDRVGRVARVGQHVGREDDPRLVLRTDDRVVVVRQGQNCEPLNVDRRVRGEVFRRGFGEDHPVTVAHTSRVEVGLVSGDVHAVG